MSGTTSTRPWTQNTLASTTQSSNNGWLHCCGCTRVLQTLPAFHHLYKRNPEIFASDGAQIWLAAAYHPDGWRGNHGGNKRDQSASCERPTNKNSHPTAVFQTCRQIDTCCTKRSCKGLGTGNIPVHHDGGGQGQNEGGARGVQQGLVRTCSGDSQLYFAKKNKPFDSF